MENININRYSLFIHQGKDDKEGTLHSTSNDWRDILEDLTDVIRDGSKIVEVSIKDNQTGRGTDIMNLNDILTECVLSNLEWMNEGMKKRCGNKCMNESDDYDEYSYDTEDTDYQYGMDDGSDYKVVLYQGHDKAEQRIFTSDDLDKMNELKEYILVASIDGYDAEITNLSTDRSTHVYADSLYDLNDEEIDNYFNKVFDDIGNR